MADPVNGLLAARMDPERRRRIGNALLAYQYNRETPQDAPVTERAGLFPLGTYANGQTGIAWPGIVATPVEKMAQVLRGEITPGTPEFNEAGFDIAGAAMVGGLAAARPRPSLGMSGRPTEGQGIRAFRGQPDDASLGKFDGTVWATNNADLADVYAMTKTATNTNGERWAENLRPRVMPVELKFKNPLSVGGDNISTWDNISHNGMNFTTDQLAAYAKAQGHDGLIVNNVIDGARSIPQTSYAALERGTVYSPLTGDLLYANARPGAALGAGLSGASERQGIRAYHGSPHDFDRFDMSKIGTGEGAQAYGHGLYFAEHEGVAKGYRDKLVDRTNFVRPDGSTWDPFTSLEHVNVRSMAGRGDIDAAIAKAKEIVASNSPVAGHAQRDLEKLINIQSTGGIKPNPGRLYEVNIKANPDDFLNWDKPLSQQSEKVRKALSRQGLMPDVDVLRKEIADLQAFKQQATTIDVGNGQRIFAGNLAAAYRRSPEAARLEAAERQLANLESLMSGAFDARNVAEALGVRHDPKGLTKKLQSEGIPGIRYLDQGSRGAGEGSRNYVVFDANLIEILRKYGLLGMLGAGGMAQELLKPSKPTIPDDAT